MIRRTTLAAMATLAALVVVAGTTHATTDVTRQCIRGARRTLTTCRTNCVNDFRTRQGQCFGPGLACATDCQTTNDGCRAPIDASQKACISGDATQTPPVLGCTDTLRAALDTCRELFDRGTIPDLDACANQARLANLQCVLNCRATYDDLFLACNTAFSQCLAACASCATPQECPAP